MKQPSWPVLPGGGQHEGDFSPSQQGHDGEAGEEGKGGEGSGEGRYGMRGTWVSEGAVKTDGGEASAGGEAEGGFTSIGPDRKKLCHRCHNKLGVSSCSHFQFKIIFNV